jgi:hypothetical protein
LNVKLNYCLSVLLQSTFEYINYHSYKGNDDRCGLKWYAIPAK